MPGTVPGAGDMGGNRTDWSPSSQVASILAGAGGGGGGGEQNINYLRISESDTCTTKKTHYLTGKWPGNTSLQIRASIRLWPKELITRGAEKENTDHSLNEH